MNEYEMPEVNGIRNGWTHEIPEDEWDVYKRVLEDLRNNEIEFAVGGGFARAVYSGHWRDTKDIDIYVVPENRDKTIEIVSGAGLADYFDVEPYDRNWIYRSHGGGTIVDVIWAMANRRTDVDERWVTRGPEIMIRGEYLRVVPVEEMIWGKLYIMQRTRCDWPDIINMIYGSGDWLDWEHLMDRLEHDLPLLTGVMSFFSWLCPGRAASFASGIWGHLGLSEPEAGPDYYPERVNLVDTRPWFVPMMIAGNISDGNTSDGNGNTSDGSS